MSHNVLGAGRTVPVAMAPAVATVSVPPSSAVGMMSGAPASRSVSDPISARIAFAGRTAVGMPSSGVRTVSGSPSRPATCAHLCM
jgi:hypothetical protein